MGIVSLISLDDKNEYLRFENINWLLIGTNKPASSLKTAMYCNKISEMGKQMVIALVRASNIVNHPGSNQGRLVWGQC